MRTPFNTWWAQAVQNRLVALVLAMVVFVALVASPLSGSANGVAALSFEGLAILLFATLLWRARLDIGRQKLAAFMRTGPNLPILLFLGWVVLSCFLSHSAAGVQEALRVGAGILLYFVVAYHFRRSEQLSKLFETLLFVGTAAALYGFAQFSTTQVTRAAGPFADPQLLASFLMVLLPIVVVVAISEKSPGRQLAAQVAAVLMTACLLLTHTRSAWLGSAAGLAVLAVLAVVAALRGRQRGLTVRRHELVLPAMLFAAVGVFLLMWPQASSIFDRAGTLSRISADESWRMRDAYRGAALEMVRARPLTGVGIGQFAYAQYRYTHVGTTLDGIGSHPSLSENAHSLWLQTAAELGIPGALLLLSALVAFLVAGVRRASGMDPGIRRNLLMGAIAATVAFAVDGIASPSWALAQVSMFFWLVLGLGVGALRPFARQREEAASFAVSPRILRPAAVMASLTLVALLPTVVFANGGAYRADLLSVDVRPDISTIKSGGAQALELLATFQMSDGSQVTEDVTPQSAWAISSGAGRMIGTYGNIYQSRPRMAETASVTGSYTFQARTMADTATIDVLR